MNTRKIRRRIPSIDNPNDPRWDVRFGVPQPHLLQLLATGKIDLESGRLTGKGGVPC